MRAPDDEAVLDAVAALLDEGGLAAVTLSAVAERAGLSRVTLHRRGTTVESAVIAVLARASDDLRAALWPVVTGAGRGADRLRQALEILCDVGERHTGVLAALFRAPVRPVPGRPATTTSLRFTEPFERLLRDGVQDGSLRSLDPDTDATLLANCVMWTYLHMREAHRWSPATTATRVVDLALASFLPSGASEASAGAAPASTRRRAARRRS